MARDDVLRAMDQECFFFNGKTYTTLLQVYCKARDMDGAFQVLDEMEAHATVEPNVVAYNTLQLVACRLRAQGGLEE